MNDAAIFLLGLGLGIILGGHIAAIVTISRR